MKEAGEFRELPVESLRVDCDLKNLKFKDTDDLNECLDIIGQKKAIGALRLGLDIDSPGYNIFAAGSVGTGRRTAAECMIQETERLKNIPDDKLYVNNFQDPDRPRLIRLPAGRGCEFQKAMDKLLDSLIKSIPEIFESEDYQQQRKEIIEKLQGKGKELLKKLEEDVKKEGFTMTQVQVGPVTRPLLIPIINDKPVNFEELSEMVDKGEFDKEEYEQLQEKSSVLYEKMEEAAKQIRNLEKESGEGIAELNRKIIEPVVEQRIEVVRKKFHSEKIAEYLNEYKEDILDNLELFQKKKKEQQPQQSLALPSGGKESDPYLVYRVNLLIDNKGADKAPVIVETSPNYNNLFGSIDVAPSGYGQWSTDFTKIKAGSLLKADGGFLIIEALDALMEPGVWSALKRTLRNRKFEWRHYTPYLLVPISALKPEAIEFDVKVVMVGESFLYQLLYTYDYDFKKIFKIRADFDTVMDFQKENTIEYANFVKKIVKNEELMPFTRKAVAAVIEFGIRLAGRQNKLSTRFNDIADILREADFWARKAKRKKVDDEFVLKAIDEKRERSRLIEDKIQEMIEEGTIMIDTEGEVLGQVNGLSVYDLGDYAFGKPSRITARVSVGGSGIINIEREAELSGRIHDKGVLILSGFLRSKYAQNRPLALSASICFEQSYGGVEGDSASSTEIYALLSALSDVPIRQEIAVTGSVNQKGEIQPIGGVNHKIEGFFEVCKAKGLNGAQGVIIPHQNVKDLMLQRHVVDAVEKGQFHIYPVKYIDEGIEILTRRKAGEMLDDGTYEKGTINYLVDERLKELADKWKNYRLSDTGMETL